MAWWCWALKYVAQHPPLLLHHDVPVPKFTVLTKEAGGRETRVVQVHLAI